MLPDLPLEILHLIFFDLWILDHRDIAAVRAVCRELRLAVLPSGLDLWKWEARAGPEWCLGLNLTRALILAYSEKSRYRLSFDEAQRLLNQASMISNSRIVKFVLSRSYDRPFEYKTAIEAACTAASEKTLRLLVESCILKKKALPRNMSIKPWCAKSGARPANPKVGGIDIIIKILLDYGWVPTAEAFVWVCGGGGCAESVCAMLAHGVGQLGPRSWDSALKGACEHNNLEVVRVLLDCGVGSAGAIDTCVQIASGLGHFDTVRLLLEHGADPTEEYSEALLRASRNGHDRVVKLLLAAGADPADHDFASLRSASYLGHLEVARTILDFGEVPCRFIHQAAERAEAGGHPGMVHLLFSCLPHRLSGQVSNRTLTRDQINDQLHAACEKGLVDLARHLLQSGRRRCSPSVWDNYAIRAASSRGHAEIVSLLLADNRVDPAANGNSAIGQASCQGHSDVVALLLGDARVAELWDSEE